MADDEEVAVELACPSKLVGRIIGPKGANIKAIRAESGARVDVNDGLNFRRRRICRVQIEIRLESIKAALEGCALLFGCEYDTAVVGHRDPVAGEADLLHAEAQRRQADPFHGLFLVDSPGSIAASTRSRNTNWW